MSFQGRVVVVAGATGVVGSGAVHAWLASGATVVGISRTPEKLLQLRETLGLDGSQPFIGVVGSFDTEEAAEATRIAVDEGLGAQPVDHVVSSLGFITPGPAVSATPFAALGQAMHDGLYTSFLASRVLMPMVAGAPGATYTLVSGGLAHATPAAGLWMGTVKNAALNAFTLGLAAEAAKSPLRVNALCIHFNVAPVGGTHNQLGFPADHDALALGPAFVGLARGKARGRVICLSDWTAVGRIAEGAEG